jgi:hypothetical protein
MNRFSAVLLALLCGGLRPGVVSAQDADAAIPAGEAIHYGEQLDPATFGPAVNESLAEMIARAAAEPTVTKTKGRNGAQGRWVIPSRGATTTPHSGEHNLVNEWGDTRMGIGFPRTVDLHGVYVSGQAGVGAWTRGIRAIGYLGGKQVKTTEWFEGIDDTPRWFEINLRKIDRVVFESIPVLQGGGWYALDDLSFSTLPRPGTDEVRERVVLDFEDAAYRQVLTGAGYAGLTWETGTGDFASADGIPAPQTINDTPDDPAPAGPTPLVQGGAGTPPLLQDDFMGPTRGDAGSFSFPPDTCGAIGPNHFVSVVNTTFSVYERNTGNRVALMTLNSFFSPFGTGGDPRVLFDQYSGRWVAISTNFSGGEQIQLAVSHTDDPTGMWFKTEFATDQGSDSGCWPDYPTLGVNQDGIYVTTFMVSCGMTVFAIDKAPLIAPSPSLGTITAFRGLSFTGAIQPVHTYGGEPDEYLIDRRTSASLRIRRVQGPLTSPTLITVGNVTVPSHFSGPDAPALGSGTPLDTVGTRLMNAVLRDGTIWTAHTVDSGGRAACRWYQINPFTSPPTLVQSGLVNDGSLHYYFPSIAVNNRGDAVMAFSGSNSGQYVGTYYTGRSFIDPTGQMAPPTLYKAGTAAQNNIDSFGRNRWGDYSLTSLDPADELTFWTIQAYGRNTDIWGTWIARLGYGDCNENDVPDETDITGGTSLDCNGTLVPDECELAGNDCNANDIPDECDITSGFADDCNNNGEPDSCELASGAVEDCNSNGIPDSCDLVSGAALDCNLNSVPDVCDIATGAAEDCNNNTIPDVCDTSLGGGSDDCNDDTIPDECQLSGNDCDGNNRPDDCDSTDLAATIVGPGDANPCPDGIATFNVSAPGATGYQWLRNGSEVLSDGGSFSGTSTATLTIDPASDGGEFNTFTCRVNFGCVQADSASGLLDLAPDMIDVSFSSAGDTSACAEGGGTLVVFEVTLDDPTGAIYQWSKGGVDLTDGGRISGSSTDQLEIANAELGDAGEYTCRVWNDCIDEVDSVSTTGTLSFIDPVFVSGPNDTCGEVGQSAVFNVNVNSPLAFALRWYENGNPIVDGGQFSGTTTDTLTVSNLVTGDDGRQFQLRAIVLNPPCSAFSDLATLTVEQPGQCPACPNAGGDMDLDGDYDLVDMQKFTDCFGANILVDSACACANVDTGNNVVDLADWLALEALINGPQ